MQHMALPTGKEPETEADLEAVEPRSSARAEHLHRGAVTSQRCVKSGVCQGGTVFREPWLSQPSWMLSWVKESGGEKREITQQDSTCK